MKQRFASAILDFMNWIDELCIKLAEAINGPIFPQSDEEKARDEASTMTIINLIRKHRCPRCQGHRVIQTEAGDDWYRCDFCGGTGIDPIVTKEGDLPND